MTAIVAFIFLGNHGWGFWSDVKKFLSILLGWSFIGLAFIGAVTGSLVLAIEFGIFN